MKATGIVRRIDDLGRIVIPKEIRRTLRIRETDPLEIFTDREGQIILKKYSPIGELASYATEYVEALAAVVQKTVCITDRDQVIAAAGSERKDLQSKDITNEFGDCMENRNNFIASSKEGQFIQPVDNLEFTNEAVSPIICAGDVLGSIVILDKDEKTKFTDVEFKLAMAASQILGKQMES